MLSAHSTMVTLALMMQNNSAENCCVLAEIKAVEQSCVCNSSYYSQLCTHYSKKGKKKKMKSLIKRGKFY